MTLDEPVVILCLYRPGSVKPTAQFYDELATVLELLVIHSCPIVIDGDFNVRAQDSADPDTRRLCDVLVSFDLVQHVRGPTHRGGNTLDLVLTFSGMQLDGVTTERAGVISDHSFVKCYLPIAGDASLKSGKIGSWLAAR